MSVQASHGRVTARAVALLAWLRSSLRRVPLPLALLLGIAAVLSLSWSLVMAQLQGPDELDHVAYVEHLAETGHIPSAVKGRGTYAPDEAGALSGSGYARLLQNRQARPPWSQLAERRYRAFEDTLPAGARGRGNGPNSVGKNPPLYYAYEAIGWKLTPGGHFFGRIFVLRLLSGLLLLVMVAFTWLLAGEIFRRQLPRTVATATVALFPMAGFMSGIVNTDIMLGAIWTAFMWLALRAARLGLTWQRAAMLSAVSALSVLTHGRGLAILPALVVALVVAWLAHEKTVRATLRSAAGAVVTVAVGFVVYRLVASAAGSGAALYGGEANLGNNGVFSVRQLLSSIWQFYLPRLDSMVPRLGPAFGYRQMFVQQYFTGVFGSFDVYFPYAVYDAVQVAAAILMIALYTIGAVRWHAVLARWPSVVVLGATAGSLVLFLHVASYRALVNGGGENPLIVGRYLVPITAVVGVAIAAIVANLPRRVGAALGAVVLAGLLALSLGGLGLSLERFYA
jgi:4-amino-4-deoxy-L-arabinose transferase-like glycosyltransferase